VSEEETLATITRRYAQTGELLCPHSAIGVRVAEDYVTTDSPMITLATAHPAKFPDAVNEASGVYPELPPRLAAMFDMPERVTQVPNDLATLQQFVKDRI
jgi:threonine synthase